ncbi:hypothetical protein J7S78_14175 [Klebsiella oxytoca]|uniref:Uncharacterized protein n=1 Tax=Klebsiella oxytoca TaxID=571 RepID=A0AAP2FLQ0_KLEOX|nr:DUF6710 family protein [Klebsiella oxytoca]MBQ0600942.1 hypothetical protein [Klebsiella oxytoca]
MMKNFLRKIFRTVHSVPEKNKPTKLPQHPRLQSEVSSIPGNAKWFAEEGKLRFDKVMSLAKSVDNAGRETLIRALIRPIQADYLLAVATEGQDAREFLDERFFFFSDFIHYFDDSIAQRTEDFSSDYTVFLAKDIVLPCPWSENRYKNALSIGTHAGNPWVSDDNHKIDVWLPWKIGFVGGGNHSLMPGILWGEGELKAYRVTDASSVFERVSTDGINWYAGDKAIEAVKDYRVAAIYEIGRLIL